MSKSERKERSRKRKRKRTIRAAVIAASIFLIVDILFALGFWWGLKTTQTLSAENSHTVTAQVENVRIKRSRRKRSLRFSAGGKSFSLRACAFFYDIDEIAQSLKDADNPVSIVVFENSFSLYGRKRPAGIYDGKTVYFDTADFNDYQAKERVSLYILAALFGVPLLLGHAAYYYFAWHIRYRKKAPKPKS